MTAIRYWQGLGLCGLAAIAFGAMADDGPKWGPHIDLEAKPGSKRSLGEADLFLPVSQDDRTLVFANLRGRFDDNSSREGNLGLGVRQMRDGGWNLGAYGYFDRRRSTTGNYFNQGTLGVEALGRNWDFRANGYLPVGTRVRTLGTTGGVSTAALSGAAIQVTTSAISTQEERALKGFDAEVGWRAPVFDSEAARQLRLYLGGYRFSDDVMTVEGPRVRAEMTMDDLNWFGKGTSLFLGLEAQNDGTRGHQNFLSLRLRIPLGKESARSRPLNAQERRMAAPVMRDVDVVTQDRSFVSTPALVETATQTAGGQTLTVLNSATTSGAALPGAVTAAGGNSTVILSGSFTTNSNATGVVTLQAGQTLMGAGTLTVTTPSGRTATLATPGATITGNVGGSNYTVVMANNSTLTGLTINNTDNTGNNAQAVKVNGVSGAWIINNTINATQTGGGGATAHGVDVVGGSSNITVSGNTITASLAGAGVGMALGIQVNGSSAVVTGNTVSASGGFNNYHTVLSTANVLAGSNGNTVIAGSCLIGVAGTGTTVSYTNAPACGP